MKLLRLVLSDLHIGTGARPGELNPLEDFCWDDTFAELVYHHDEEAGEDAEFELVLNGDIFDLMKVKVDGKWPLSITDEIATNKLRQCLDGHPRVVNALKHLLSKERRRLVYILGNHDLEMCFPGTQDLLRRYIAPVDAPERLHFVTSGSTYYLPEGIQIQHGHQLEHIHRVDYDKLTRTNKDGVEELILPWGHQWILEVMLPAKEERSYVDRAQPLNRFLLLAILFDTRFAIRFISRTVRYFLRRRIFDIGAWRERLRRIRERLRDEIIALGGYDEAAVRTLKKMRGVHCLIVGHSHGPRYRQLDDGKLLVNTGTWMRMINVDLAHLGQNSGLTYCRIDYDEEGQPHVQLLRWLGSPRKSVVIPYAD